VTERDIAILFADRTSSVTAAQIMSEKVVTALPKTTIFEAEKTMVTRGFRRLPIVSDDKLVGIVTAMDILRFFGCGDVFKHLRSGTIGQVLNTPALEIASKNVSVVEPETDVGQAARTMREKDIGAVPVVKNGKLVGILTERDFFKILT
jgi:CBS domain-containing protein